MQYVIRISWTLLCIRSENRIYIRKICVNRGLWLSELNKDNPMLDRKIAKSD